MKRKWLSRKDWRRVVRRQDWAARLEIAEFTGYAHLLEIQKIKSPLVVTRYAPPGQAICLANDGYTWIMLLPDGQDYVITGQIDENDHLVQIYVDMIAGCGMLDGDIYFDDIYIDVIMLSDKSVLIDDEDELAHALRTSEISRAQYERATANAARVCAGIRENPDKWIGRVYACRDALVQKREEAKKPETNI